MEVVIIAELAGAIAVFCLLIGMCVRRDATKPALRLKVVEISVIVWALIDACAYWINGPEYPLLLLKFIYLLTYLCGGFCLLCFLYYCKSVLEEKVAVNRFLFYLPAAFVGAAIIYTVFSFCRGGMIAIDNGYIRPISDAPVMSSTIQFLVLIFIPLMVLGRTKAIGLKYVAMLGSYGLFPLIAALVAKITHTADYTVAATLLSVVVVAEMLQNDMVISKEREQKNVFEDKQRELEERMAIIQSMGKVYFVSFYVHFKDRSFTEISNTDFVKKFVGSSGNAQDAFYIMCDKMVHPESAPALRRFVDLDTLDERMKNKHFITCDYEGNVAGWCQLYIIEGDRDEEGNLETIFVAARTIHDEKTREIEQNKALIEAREAAERANQSKTIFLNNMSHDIRTPMNAILGFAELMQKEKDNPEIISNYLAKIQHSGEYLLTIINNVLDMARIESGNTVVDEQYYDLLDENKSASIVFEEQFKRKNITFTRVIDVEHTHVLIDITKVQQIVVNLISNAVKYTPEGGEVHMLMNEIPSEHEGYATYVISVSDTGIGMSKEFKEHVFDSFAREKNTTESKVIGTGLGMSIVKKLVELMNGTIEVESESGVGTTFTVTLDFKIAANPEKYIEEQCSEEIDTISLEGKRVLLSEDNELNAEIATALLGERGLIVEHAEDGVQCLDMLNKAENGYYDLILMDIQMPNMNGYEATRCIRELEDEVKAGIPIIAMTANAFEEDRKLAFEAGMDEHLPKPFKTEVVINTIIKVLAKKNCL